jgi:anti-sigma regulatory factor (Ser/Thr protein kinase)
MARPDLEAIQPQPVPRIRLSFNAELSELAPASERIRSFLSEHGIDKDALFAIDMVIEEIATNSIKYGFNGMQKGIITMEAAATATHAELVIEDDGRAFNPTEAPDPDVNRPLEEMPIGGLGIHLVRALTDDFDYQRVNDCNRVRVSVHRKKQTEK